MFNLTSPRVTWKEIFYLTNNFFKTRKTKQCLLCIKCIESYDNSNHNMQRNISSDSELECIKFFFSIMFTVSTREIKEKINKSFKQITRSLQNSSYLEKLFLHIICVWSLFYYIRPCTSPQFVHIFLEN